MVPNPLNVNDEDKKPDKLESETAQHTAEGAYMMSDIGSKVDSCTFFQPLDPTDTYDKLESLQPLNPADAYDRLPPPIKAKMSSEQQQQGAMEYAVLDTSKKKQKRNEQQNVDDAHNDTYDDVLHCDEPTDTVPCNDEHRSDAASQNADNPALHYAVLQTLPPPTDAYVAKDDDAHTPYALLV